MKKTIIALSVILLSACSTPTPEATQNSTEPNSQKKQQSVEMELTPVSSITHSHGIAVDAADESKVYIATHDGLLLLKNDTSLNRIGKTRHDFMGFSAHTSKENIFYASGHPKTGGNLGILKSEDKGMSWKKISSGMGGPVDFHSMTLSSADPNILYGWYGNLQRSTDAGETWEIINTDVQKVIALYADPHQANTVYAATQTGLYKSEDQGVTWTSFNNDKLGGITTAFAIDPSNPNNMIAYVANKGAQYSNDGGETWTQSESNVGLIMFVAYSPSNASTIYGIDQANIIYKSTDGGVIWNKVMQ